SAKDALEAAEQHRRQLEKEHEAAIEKHDLAAETTRARLYDDPLYIAKADAVETAGAMVEQARIKADAAAAERAEKGAPFEADRFFMYLHDRQYATPSYRAVPPIKAIDSWVAGLIDFRKHRLNYERLLELPERLTEHVVRLEEAAVEAEEAIEQMERDALSTDGVDKLRENAAALAKDLETADEKIEETEKSYHDASAAFDRAANGEEGPISDARNAIASALTSLSVPQLRDLADATQTLEDDRLVDALIRLKRERMEYEDARKSSQKFNNRRKRSLSDLEEIRRRFKAARYDSPYSNFRGERLIESLIGELLGASIGRDELWRRIQKGHRTRRRDWETDFGGDDWRDVFGMPGDTRQGPWSTTGGWAPKQTRSKSRRRRPRIRRYPRPRGGLYGGFPPGSFGGGWGGGWSGGGWGGGGSSGGGGFDTGGGF
ncbi:MAG: hypothetical protein AAF692_13185, partial [Pseudomonadota bacterium]